MRAKRLRYIVVLAVLAAAAAMLVGAPITSARSGAGGQSPLTAQVARAFSTNVTDKVIRGVQEPVHRRGRHAEQRGPSGRRT